MFSKTLIVCLLALICLQFSSADRLNTRIASQFESRQGQFPYIAAIAYSFFDTTINQTSTYRGTGIIYSANSVITTANVFNKFPIPPAQTEMSISVGAFDYTLPAQFFVFNASIGKYNIPPVGQTPPPPTPELVLIPTQFVPGSSVWDIAIIRLPVGSTFNFTIPEIAIGNFPTASPIKSDNLWAIAYGNQSPGAPTFPILKMAKMFLKTNSKCQQNITAAGVTRPFSFNQNFCVQSKSVAPNTVPFQGVCAKDIGGALIRTQDISNATSYYEIIGLISWTSDNFTCNPINPVPAIIIYLSIYQDNFFTPVLGSLATVGNKQNPNAFPGRKNNVCGNGRIEAPEQCDPEIPAGGSNPDPCCNTNICQYKTGGSFCGLRPKAGKPNKCQSRLVCGSDHICEVNNKLPKKKACNGKGSKCVNGVCVKA